MNDPHYISPATNKSVLRSENLNIGYRSRKSETEVCRKINFELQPGELGAIVGINGVGKSTLLRTLGGVQPQLSGEVYIGDRQLTAYSGMELAREISLVLTEAVVTKNLTVKQLISIGRHPYTNWIGTLAPDDHQMIYRAIDRVGLDTIKDKKCFELSDGQLQKVMIARALVQDTRIILLDEPTTHLDLYHKVYILKLLRQIAHETDKTVLFTTHEIELAIQLCDKILILDPQNPKFGRPETLVADSSFEKLFPRDTIVFDPDSSTFKVNK